MSEKNLRQVLYNVETDVGEQVALRHRWTFLLVNDLTELSLIKERILKNLAPSDNYNRHAEGLVQNSGGLHYLAFSLSSENGILRNDQWRKIYDKPEGINSERKFNERKSNPEEWFDKYVSQNLKKR
ncbi:hypothetical protein J4474_02915 [Candidatus Pacearchaeota archaeon]|nr:hypothetical protein [Candidatus Pacearchaeota archaeon]